MQFLGLLGMNFDAVVVEVTKNLLLFRLALAVLWMTAAAATALWRANCPEAGAKGC